MSSEVSQGGGEVQWLKEWLIEATKWKLEGWQRGVSAVLGKSGSGEMGQNRSWQAVATTPREQSSEPVHIRLALRYQLGVAVLHFTDCVAQVASDKAMPMSCGLGRKGG